MAAYGCLHAHGIIQIDAYHGNICLLQTLRTREIWPGKGENKRYNGKYSRKENQQMSETGLLFGFLLYGFKEFQVGKIIFPVPPEIKQVDDNGNGNRQKSEKPVWMNEFHI